MPLATPVTVLSISSVGGVVTVTTSSAHGLIANQGFSLQNVPNLLFNVNGTVLSVTSATVFTFNSGVMDAVSSGGTVGPAKEIIVLTTNAFLSNSTISVNYLLWLTTTTPNAVSTLSAWKGASTQENSAILNGTTVELARSVTVSATITKAQLEAAIQQDFVVQQTAFSAVPPPGAFYGVCFDGIGWSS